MVPSLGIAVQGQGVTSADQLNTYLQGCVTIDDLRNFTGVPTMQVWVAGTSAPADGGQGMFYWASVTNAIDNGTSVIVPQGQLFGAWLRIPFIIENTASTTPLVQPFRQVTSGSTDNAKTTDGIIGWNVSFTGTKTENLLPPASVTPGQQVIIKDIKGDCNINPIRVTAPGGTTIDSGAYAIMNVARMSLTVISDGNLNWMIV